MKALPGFGEQKARIFVALLGKQLGVRPTGWEKASAPYGEAGSFRSVADIDSPEALAKVRQSKQTDEGQGQSHGRLQPAEHRWVRTGLGPGRPAPLSVHARPTRPGALRRPVPRRRRGRRPAPGQAPGRRPAWSSGPPWSSGSVPTTGCPSSSTTGPTWPRPSVPTASTSARTTSLPTEARRLVGVRRHHRAVDPRHRRAGAGARRPADTGRLHLGRAGHPHPDQAGAAGHRARLRRRGGDRSPVCRCGSPAGSTRHGGRRWPGRRPPLRGGALAHRAADDPRPTPVLSARPSIGRRRPSIGRPADDRSDRAPADRPVGAGGAGGAGAGPDGAARSLVRRGGRPVAMIPTWEMTS